MRLAHLLGSSAPSRSQSMPSKPGQPSRATTFSFQSRQLAYTPAGSFVTAGCGAFQPPIEIRCVVARPARVKFSARLAMQP